MEEPPHYFSSYLPDDIGPSDRPPQPRNTTPAEHAGPGTPERIELSGEGLTNALALPDTTGWSAKDQSTFIEFRRETSDLFDDYLSIPELARETNFEEAYAALGDLQEKYTELLLSYRKDLPSEAEELLSSLTRQCIAEIRTVPRELRSRL